MHRPKHNLWLLSAFIGMAALSRLLPHPANMTAVGAMALFSGAYISHKMIAFCIPLVAMLVSDSAIELLYRLSLTSVPGFHATLPLVYISFALSVIIGFWIGIHPHITRIITGGFLSSTSFFFITNFAVWLEGYYGYTLNGLLTCYIAALPFYRNTLLGDAFYIALLFGSFELVKYKFPALAYVKQQSRPDGK